MLCSPSDETPFRMANPRPLQNIAVFSMDYYRCFCPQPVSLVHHSYPYQQAFSIKDILVSTVNTQKNFPKKNRNYNLHEEKHNDQRLLKPFQKTNVYRKRITP
jgi:hypothetical protein